jgi:hypothetical protein
MICKLISTLSLWTFCFGSDVVGQQLTKEDSVLNARSKPSGWKEDSLIKAGVKFRIMPQDDITYKGFEEASKHRIHLKDVMKHIGEGSTVDGKVFGYSENKEGFLETYVGAPYPNHLLLLLIPRGYLALANRIKGKHIMIIGHIWVFNSRATVFITEEKQILLL